MIIKTILISVILVAIIMLALGVKLLFDKDAEFTVHSCSLEDEGSGKDQTCSSCELKEIADCGEVSAK
jgi:hypothetical protein